MAKLLGFGYPGGPILDRLAPYGDPEAVRFTLARMKGNTLDFSFSGLKTAVLRWTQQRDLRAKSGRAPRTAAEEPASLGGGLAGGDSENDAGPGGILPADGDRGVAAPRRGERRTDSGAFGDCFRRRGLQRRPAHGRAARKLPFPVHFPSPGLSTDNAAMIAAAAFPKFRRGDFSDATLRAQANLALA